MRFRFGFGVKKKRVRGRFPAFPFQTTAKSAITRARWVSKPDTGGIFRRSFSELTETQPRL